MGEENTFEYGYPDFCGSWNYVSKVVGQEQNVPVPEMNLQRFNAVENSVYESFNTAG
jgi:hypothetical protein